MNHGVRLFIGVVLFNCILSDLCVAQVAGDATQPAKLKRSWVDLARYSGKPGSAQVTQSDFRQLAFELQAARSLQAPNTLAKAQRQPYETVRLPRNNLRNRVPLSVIRWNRDIAQVTPAQKRRALDTGVAPVPFSTNVTVFAFSPVRSTTYHGADLTFTLDSDDFFEEISEQGKPIVSLNVNTGDGSGWQELGLGKDVSSSYAETGTKKIKMEAKLADGTVLSASATLNVLALFTPQPTETVALSGGQLYIYKSGDHAGLRCPVFVVEGFDMNNDMDWDYLYNSLNKEQLAETLKSYGRDLVVLDFTDAMSDILWENAFVAMDAINYINSIRSSMDDKFTVVGASMGGLVSRFTLALMDENPASYGQGHVNTWISFDSPQEGANIPLGLQEFFAFLGGIYSSSGYSDLAMAANYKQKLDSPAAQQMLLCHYKANSNLAARSPAYSTFESTLSTYGYPTSAKRIAISNGSKYGLSQNFSAGAEMIHWYYYDFWIDLECNIYAMNVTSSPAAKIYHGNYNRLGIGNDYTCDKYRYYPYSVDRVAGGTRASFQQLFDELPSEYLDGGDYCYYPGHCFIPTTSALGIPKEYMEKSIYDNPSVVALSPFDEIHCADGNEAHIEINRTNKEWFMKAILEAYDTDGDGMDDYQEYVLGTDYSSTNKVEFMQTAVTATGEGDTGCGAFNAVVPVFGIGPASVNVYVLPGTASTLDYVAPASPLTLTWAEGEAGTKSITVPIRGDRIAEGPEVFYLALGSTFSDRIGEMNICTATIPDDDQGVVLERGVFVMGLPQSPEGGKVYGAKYCLAARTVTLSSSANSGWTFLRWEDGSQVPSRTVSYDQAAAAAQDGVMLCRAFFKKTTGLTLPAFANPGLQHAMVGLTFDWPLPIISECLPKVTVAGLPAGLKYDANRVCFVGVPTKAGTFSVTVTVSNPKGVATPQVFTMQVDSLPVWAQGVFNGVVSVFEQGAGVVSMNVTLLGGVTGKFSLQGTNFSFSARSFASRDEGGAFTLLATAQAGTSSRPLTVALTVSECIHPEGIVPKTLSQAEGLLGGEGWATLYRNVWKDAGMGTVATNFAGYYTATLAGGGEYGSGYLTFTVDKAGGVKTTGKLADGTAVSLGGTLILDEAGRVFAVLYNAPAAYKGGCLFGLAEFFKVTEGARVLVRVLDDTPFLWESFNPQATQEYGAGFSRKLGFAGGWYDAVGNLYGYYAGRALSIGTDGAPVPQADVGTNRYASVWWDPDGIALSVVTNRLGAMTGLAAPAASWPVKVGTNTYEYAGVTNAVGLTVSLTRATGVFKGSFKAWFDSAAAHTPKLIAYEGVLTPEREDMGDGTAGRGFFLWPDKSHYLNPQNKPVPYSFNWSYDLKILLSEP